ncbi:short-chain dehydrogenase [Intrasporangium oryzae NRRL B-24470]|uniref:Short-chain dehydrogenase n=1 Tax=Intrasporangium oryzae NRRL B-24470 TaxID=1386089 RepID=W9GDP0_9MICO|nr:short-chain dehydrogenase [Intrasporangium oryzae NRRL B-24470]
MLVARREPELEALAAALRSSGAEALVVAGDVTDVRFTERLAATTATLSVGLVVLAAGFGSLGAFVDRELADEVAMIEVNVVAVTRLAHLFAGRLAAQGCGGLVLFGSIVAGQGTPLQANYAATKAYVRSLGEALSVELRPHGVDVLVVSPGPVDTGFADRAGMTMPSAAAPEVVARAALRSIGRRGSVVPGVRARLLTFGLALAPRRLRTRIMHRVMRGMLGPEPPDQRAVAPSGSGGTVRPSSGTESRPGT